MTETPESGTRRTELDTMTGPPHTVERPRYDDGYQWPNRLTRVLASVGIVVGVVFIVAMTFFAGFFVGRDGGDNFGGVPATAQPLYCQAQCIGETNVSYQSWVDCINRCMASGGGY